MPSRTSKRLVIDASVARASGKTDHPTSKNCRDFLTAILEICHRITMTPDIRDEWRKHQSNFARRWRVSMVARRKFCFVDDCSDDDLRNRIEEVASSEQNCKSMLKDCLLIEAALATDQTIISLDKTARRLFALACLDVRALREIVWINPDNSDEQPVEWLRKGAKPERNRKLKFGIVR